MKTGTLRRATKNAHPTTGNQKRVRYNGQNKFNKFNKFNKSNPPSQNRYFHAISPEKNGQPLPNIKTSDIMATIKNLAFKGGGVLGIAYAGAIKVLEDRQILQNIEKVAGTSAGAITATLVSLGYNSTDIKNIVNGTSFKSFEDKKNILRIFSKYGLYAGDATLAWLKQQIAQKKDKNLSENATFRDFHNAGCRDLYVFASDLNLRTLAEFSFRKTPDVVVAEAVRASMSIPLFFKAWRFSNNNPNDHLYVDGGMIFNFPIDIFDQGGVPNPETMGLYLSNVHAVPKANNLGYNSIVDYVKITFETILDAQPINFINNPDQLSRTAIIDDLGISPVNFNLSVQQEEALYQSGIDCTNAFFVKNPA
jgi:NTE family protein